MDKFILNALEVVSKPLLKTAGNLGFCKEKIGFSVI
jgi:hypothetical protein